MFRLKEVSWGAQPELSSQFKTSEFERDATLISDSMVVVSPYYKIKRKIKSLDAVIYTYHYNKFFAVTVGGMTTSVNMGLPFSD